MITNTSKNLRMASKIIGKDEGQIQIHLYTKQKQYAIADTPYAISANTTTQDLNILINTLLSESSPEDSAVNFEFLIRGEFLKQTIKQFLRERDISFEDFIDIEYIQRFPTPEPQDCLLHDDWVSAVQACDNWILTGSYDSSLTLWTIKGEHKLTIPGHEAPIKDVTWVTLNEQKGIFASASQDQTIMIWEWSIAKNSVECIQVCKGHERGVDCVNISPDKTKLATGGWDTMLKIWSTDLNSLNNGSDTKRPRPSTTTKVALLTIDGHREAISAVQFMDNNCVMTASWDHTIKIWDLNLSGVKHEIVGHKSFFDASYSNLNKLIITASPDKNLKLYDPRSNQGILVKNTYYGHSLWVNCVAWSSVNEFLFISGSYDNYVKLWDHRSPKVPLFDLTGHEGKFFCNFKEDNI